MIKEKIERSLNICFSIIESICKIILLFMATTVTAQVIIRVFGGNISWCEEIMLLLLNSLMFLLLPIGIKGDLHIRIGVFAKKFPRKVRIALVYVSDVIMLLVVGCMIKYGALLMKHTYAKLTVTGLPRKYLYLITVISGVLCTIVLIGKLFGLFATQTTKDFIEGTITIINEGQEA